MSTPTKWGGFTTPKPKARRASLSRRRKFSASFHIDPRLRERAILINGRKRGQEFSIEPVRDDRLETVFLGERMEPIPLQHSVRLACGRPAGTLTYLVKAFAPNRPAPELPDAEYILIEWLESTPRGSKLLFKHARDVIADIRAQFGGGRKIILQPSNFKTPAEQARLERYYQKCGFAYLPTSPTKWWMYWPHE